MIGNEKRLVQLAKEGLSNFLNAALAIDIRIMSIAEMRTTPKHGDVLW